MNIGFAVSHFMLQKETDNFFTKVANLPDKNMVWLNAR
jgi:hypothetical protein